MTKSFMVEFGKENLLEMVVGGPIKVNEDHSFDYTSLMASLEPSLKKKENFVIKIEYNETDSGEDRYTWTKYKKS